VDRSQVKVDQARTTPGEQVRGQFPTGVTVVTGLADGSPYGMTVSAFNALGSDSAAVWVRQRASVHAHMCASSSFAVNILAADQASIAKRFAAPGADRFADVDWAPGAHGDPLLRGVSAVMEVEISERLALEGYSVFFGRITAANAFDIPPLVWWKSTFWDSFSLEAVRI
jgi:flavin reductase (DIM6/NTAB) family NADH-FMN oxidoreductase RutF